MSTGASVEAPVCNTAYLIFVCVYVCDVTCVYACDVTCVYVCVYCVSVSGAVPAYTVHAVTVATCLLGSSSG